MKYAQRTELWDCCGRVVYAAEHSGPPATRQVERLRYTLDPRWKERRMPNAIDLLKADHAHLKDLFQQYKAAGHQAHGKKHSIAEEVFAELDVHTTLEEELFYPAMKQKTDQD